MRPLRIQLIVTGMMEQQALHHSLKQVFGEQRGEQPVEWLRPHRIDGMTSSRLSSAKAPPGTMRRAARTLLNYVKQREESACDLVLLLDDVEVYNRDQPECVVQLFRGAVQAELDKIACDGDARASLELRLKSTASVHLFQSMPENYFFGDPEALQAAEVSPLLPRLCSQDMESFEVCDPHPDWKAECARDAATKRSGNPGWKYEWHAKHYFQYLVERDGLQTYAETRHSLNALRALSWSRVPGGKPMHMPILRALFQDLADWFSVPNFSVPNPLGAGALHPAVYPFSDSSRQQCILRNL